MNSTSCSRWSKMPPGRQPRSSTGPDAAQVHAQFGGTQRAQRGLPQPGGPNSNTWSRLHRACANRGFQLFAGFGFNPRIPVQIFGEGPIRPLRWGVGAAAHNPAQRLGLLRGGFPARGRSPEVIRVWILMDYPTDAAQWSKALVAKLATIVLFWTSLYDNLVIRRERTLVQLSRIQRDLMVW